MPIAPDAPRRLHEHRPRATVAGLRDAAAQLLLARNSTRVSAKPAYAPGRTVFTYRGQLTNVPFPGVDGAPNVLNKSYTITAEIDVPRGGAEGMLVTDGGRFGGYGLYLLGGSPSSPGI